MLGVGVLNVGVGNQGVEWWSCDMMLRMMICVLLLGGIWLLSFDVMDMWDGNGLRDGKGEL